MDQPGSWDRGELHDCIMFGFGSILFWEINGSFGIKDGSTVYVFVRVILSTLDYTSYRAD